MNRIILAPVEVLERIAPLDPDNLSHLGEGIYRATWMDDDDAREQIQALCQLPVIEHLSTLPLTEPRGWVEVRFWLLEPDLVTTHIC